MIQSEDVWDFIVDEGPTNINIEELSEEVCFQRVNGNWTIAYAALDGEETPDISRLGYQTIPKLYGLLDTTSMDASGVSATLNQPFLDVAGQGTIVGFIDTGIDFTLDIFKKTLVESRIGVIWDQSVSYEQKSTDKADDTKTIQSESSAVFDVAPLRKMFSYGAIYDKSQIDSAVRIFSNGGNPYDVVDSRDTNGHGTFVAGIAAGGQDGEHFKGAAPEAELAVVKLKQAKKYLRDFYMVDNNIDAFQENDIMLGVSFLLQYATLRRMPIVIYIGLGSGQGPRTGATPLGSVLSETARIPNVVVVTAIGNEANSRLHVFGRVSSLEEPEIIEINVDNNVNGLIMELWASTLDVLSVSIESPSGEIVPRIPARGGVSNVFEFLLEDTRVSVDYKVIEPLSGYELVFFRFVAPKPGIWKIRVYSLTNIEGAYNAWLPLAQFVNSDTFFLRASPNTTLTEPSAALPVISVGAYDHRNGADYINSSRGYTAQGQVKPEISAPGVGVYGPAVGGGYTYKSGSSVAAAHVAGAAALLLTWGVYYNNLPVMGTSDVKYILIRGAVRNSTREYPNRINGYGFMNLIDSFLQLRVT